MKVVEKILIIAALISIPLSIYMINEYVTTYRKIMNTEIKAIILNATFQNEELKMELKISIIAQGTPFIAHKIQYTLYLNGKYMLIEKLTEPIQLIPGKEVIIQRKLTMPKERMFTVWEAVEEGKWMWRVSGTLFTRTYLGETLIRFRSSMNFPPKNTPLKD